MLERRKEIVEHIFGTLKRAMVHDHFLLRRRLRVGSEVSLSVLTYNIKRVVKIVGVGTLLDKLKSLLLALSVVIFALFVPLPLSYSLFCSIVQRLTIKYSPFSHSLRFQSDGLAGRILQTSAG
jgi:hypothetical protein